MSVVVQTQKQVDWLNALVKQLQENVVKCVVEIEGIVIQKLQPDVSDSVVLGLNKIIEYLDSAKLLIHNKSCVTPFTYPSEDLSLVTPKKTISSYSQQITFGFTSQIKTAQDFQSLASANDDLYKQYEEMLEKYRYNKQTLNHENQIVLNQWIENTNHISSATHLAKGQKKSTFFNLVKSLIQQLSKYESVEEYINTVQQIQHDKIVNELRSTSLETNDVQKKWLKETTKDYLLKMAELLRNEENVTTDDEEIQNIHQEELEGMF